MEMINLTFVLRSLWTILLLIKVSQMKFLQISKNW